MDKLAKLDKAKPYNLPLKVKVIADVDVVDYQKHEEDRQKLTVAVADESWCAKCISYCPGPLEN